MMTKLERRFATITACIGAGGLLVSVVQCSNSSPSPQPIPADLAKVKIEVSASPQPTPAEPSKLSQIMTGETIGRSLDYIEGIIGKPSNVGTPQTTDAQRYYKVDDCNVSLRVDPQTNAVTALSLEVNNRCSFNWKDMNPNLAGLPEPNNITFSQFFRDDVTTVSQVDGCASYRCGNAADPGISMTRFGSHADGWVFVTVAATIDSPREISATTKLQNRIEAVLGSEVADDLGSVCSSTIPKMMFDTIGNLKIERIEFTNDVHANAASKCELTAE